MVNEDFKRMSTFAYITSYSDRFSRLICRIAHDAENNLSITKLKDIGIFLFGSPSRQEMVEESDADIMIIRAKDDENYLKFRGEFIRILKMNNFPKVDVPEWGTLEDCEVYLKFSIPEGNQVMEAKFIYGDEEIQRKIISLKEKYCNEDRLQRVLCFQKLYFDQYYEQRNLNKSVKNVKYGHGGTRDLMFVTWFSNLLDVSNGNKIYTDDDSPLIYKSLGSLYQRKLFNFEDYKKYLKSINVVLLLRNEILIQNRGIENEGLTYLDEETIKRLFERKIFKEDFINSVEELKEYLENNLNNVRELKDQVWFSFLNYLSNTKGFIWAENFKKMLDGKIDNKIFRDIQEGDILTQIALVWNIHKANLFDLQKEVFERYSSSKSWEVLASLCCHSRCPPYILDKIAMEIGIKKGYEYLLRIIARNKNTEKETLKKIMDNSNLEERFRVVAQTAYNIGVEKANELR